MASRVTRIFRGVTYQIAVKRKGPGNAVRLEVDGVPIAGNLIPLPEGEQKIIQVTAWLGDE